MIDNSHAVACQQEALILHLLRPVRIHYDQQRTVVRHHDGILRRDEGVLVRTVAFEHRDKFLAGVVVRIDDNPRRRAAFARDTAQTDRAADAVQIRETVPHDEHAVRVRNQFAQRVCHHAGLDFRAGLHLAAASAVELEIETVLDHCLIAAARQSHFD